MIEVGGKEWSYREEWGDGIHTRIRKKGKKHKKREIVKKGLEFRMNLDTKR